jgi:hypothetical protein
VRKRSTGIFAEYDFRSGPRRKLTVAANEVCVQMGLNHVLDSKTPCCGFGQVLINVALGIDDGRFTIGPDQIRSMSETI